MLNTLRRHGGARLRTMAITPLLAVALTACGAGDDNDSGGKQNSAAGSSPSVDPLDGYAELPEQPAPGSGSAGGGSGDADASDLELAACLRGLGYDVQDPEPGEALGIDAPPDALEKCGFSLGSPSQ